MTLTQDCRTLKMLSSKKDHPLPILLKIPLRKLFQLIHISQLKSIMSQLSRLKFNIPREWRHDANFSNEFIIGYPNEKMKIRTFLKKQASLPLIYQIKPKRMNKAIEDESWIQTMKHELDQLESNQVWVLTKKSKKCLVMVILK